MFSLMRASQLFASESGDFTVFNEIALIIAIAVFVSLVMKTLRQPLLISHIITGVIVGPAVLNIIHSDEAIGVFGNIGTTLLLFIIGLGLNPKVIKEVGKTAAIAGSAQIIITSIVGYFVAQLVGLDKTASSIAGVALAFSSTIIFMKLISDKKEQNRLYAKLAIGVLLIQDIVATIALLVLSSSNTPTGLGANELMMLLIKLTFGLLTLWVIAAHILPRMKNVIASSQEFLFLFALGWGLGIASIFENLGFSLEIGALLAGVGLATQSYTPEISSRLKPLRDFFVVVFFIALGSELVLNDFLSILWPSLVLSVLVIVGNPIIVIMILGLLGYTRKISYKIGVGVAQISEFSLVFAILAERQGRIDSATLSIITLVGLITIAVSTYMITYDDKLYHLIVTRFPMFENKKVKFDQREASDYPIVLFGYRRGGEEFIASFKSINKKFVIVDYDPSVIDILESKGYHYLYGDATDPEMLDEVGIQGAQLVVSTIANFESNKLLITSVRAANPHASVICYSDNPSEALSLYEHGASYVILTHTIGSEKISSIIKKNGLKKTVFTKYREKHVASLVSKLAED